MNYNYYSIMRKIKFQNVRLRAECLEILRPTDVNSTPLEYDIYANGVRLGTTINRVLNFKYLLGNAYEQELRWVRKAQPLIDSGGFALPELTASHGQIFMMNINKCPSLGTDLGSNTDVCWTKLNVGQINEWMAVPHTGGEDIIDIDIPITAELR